MNKSELIAAIAQKSGLTKDQASTALEATFDTIKEVMISEGKILVPGFGSFATSVRAERKGRNPATGQEITIPKATVARFKPAAQLKDEVNK